MSTFLDRKYIQQISYKLPLFKWKKETLANFRCVVCGDSKRNTSATRGYLIRRRDGFQYFCHNCDASMPFGKFLKGFDPAFYKQYSVESFKERFGSTEKPASNSNSVFELSPPKVDISSRLGTKSHVTRLMDLPLDHFAVQYFKSRRLPKRFLYRLLYADNLQEFVDNNLVTDRHVPTTPYIIIPYYSFGEIVGISARSLTDNGKHRYIKINTHDRDKLIFGLEDINIEQIVYVTEGEFDAMFIPNAIAVGGISSISGIEEHIGVPKDRIVIVCDKEPRNKEVVKGIDRLINLGYAVVLFLDTLEGKDVNDFVIKYNLSQSTLLELLEKNTYKGLMAQLFFSNWKRC